MKYIFFRMLATIAISEYDALLYYDTITAQYRDSVEFIQRFCYLVSIGYSYEDALNGMADFENKQDYLAYKTFEKNMQFDVGDIRSKYPSDEATLRNEIIARHVKRRNAVYLGSVTMRVVNEKYHELNRSPHSSVPSLINEVYDAVDVFNSHEIDINSSPVYILGASEISDELVTINFSVRIGSPQVTTVKRVSDNKNAVLFCRGKKYKFSDGNFENGKYVILVDDIQHNGDPVYISVEFNQFNKMAFGQVVEILRQLSQSLEMPRVRMLGDNYVATKLLVNTMGVDI